jgi:hypothetical protein
MADNAQEPSISSKVVHQNPAVAGAHSNHQVRENAYIGALQWLILKGTVPKYGNGVYHRATMGDRPRSHAQVRETGRIWALQ